MGCIWSKCGLPSLSTRSRVIDDRIAVKAFSGKTVINLTHVILARAIPEEKSVRFAQHSPVYEDAALDLRGYDGSDECEFQMPFNLYKNLEEISEAQLGRMIAKLILPQNGKPKPTSPVQTSAADAGSNSGSTPENGEDCCIDHLVPVLDHDMLWALLRARPGWERDLVKKYGGRRKPSCDNSSIEYRIWIRKTRTQFQLAIYCLPWPNLYAASTDYLISFVKMVNVWAGSEVFKLRRISNDKAKRLEDNVVNFSRVTAPPGRLVPENDMFSDGSCAASGDSMRTTMERNSRKEFFPSVFSNDSTAFIELDPITGRIRRAAKGHPLPTPAQDRRSHENRPSEVSEQVSAWPAHMFTTDQLCGAGARSATIHPSEMLEQTWTVPPNMFQNIPKPGLGPPPMIDFSGQKKQELLEELSTIGLVQGTGYGTLLTSDSVRLPVAQTRNGFDATVAQGRRQNIVTFANPYQSPPRAATQKYGGSKSSSSHEDHSTSPNTRDDGLRDFFAPVVGASKVRLTV